MSHYINVIPENFLNEVKKIYPESMAVPMGHGFRVRATRAPE
ncbi:MAG: hypothetical protein SFW62_10110 [Alphaproteobacteria bacterium]|nr:hypothetical protein [Alphaproteobacteria bacterium]